MNTAHLQDINQRDKDHRWAPKKISVLVENGKIIINTNLAIFDIKSY